MDRELLIEIGCEEMPASWLPALTRQIGRLVDALLKAVAYGWRQEAIAENAQRIADLGRELYSRICTLGGHFGDIKKYLDKTVEAYNKAVASLEVRVLTSARRFRELEAGTDQDLDLLEGVERVTRTLHGAEFEVGVA